MIAPQAIAAFVAAMEQVLDIYRRPYDAKHPVVCMNETPQQLIRETRQPIAAAPGRPERPDCEYERCGVCNVFMASELLARRRLTKVTERRTKADWAMCVQDITASYPDAERITRAMDNLNRYTPGSLYETFSPERAKALWGRFEFVHTPHKHGSWLNMAEIEINVTVPQCLSALAGASTASRRYEAKSLPGKLAAITFRLKSTGNSPPRRHASSSNAFIRQLPHDATLIH